MSSGTVAPPVPPCEFTPPEVWTSLKSAKNGPATAAADVWAFGAIAFHLLSGEAVLRPAQQPRIAADELRSRAEAAAAAGALGTLRSVVLECLADRPQGRPTARAIVPVRSWKCTSPVLNH
jgi:serine/threonine protein kinase